MLARSPSCLPACMHAPGPAGTDTGHGPWLPALPMQAHVGPTTTMVVETPSSSPPPPDDPPLDPAEYFLAKGAVFVFVFFSGGPVYSVIIT